MVLEEFMTPVPGQSFPDALLDWTVNSIPLYDRDAEAEKNPGEIVTGCKPPNNSCIYFI